jgi:hypothetical protein
MIVNIDKKTAGESNLLRTWVSTLVEDKLNGEIRSTRTWTAQQINKAKEWFHVPGIITSPTNTNLPAAYPSYEVFVKSIVTKMTQNDESLVHLRKHLSDFDHKHNDLVKSSTTELMHAKGDFLNRHRDLRSEIDNFLTEIKTNALKTAKQNEIRFDETKATILRMEFEPAINEFIKNIIPYSASNERKFRDQDERLM